MSRLLHAAARGARIQNSYHNWQCGGDEWREANLNMLLGARIHPSDEHLQYGPVSTALRFHAESAVFDDVLTFHDDLGSWAVSYMDYVPYASCQNRLHRSLFLLILSEALADDGL